MLRFVLAGLTAKKLKLMRNLRINFSANGKPRALGQKSTKRKYKY
jgi:hypothetical protein